MNTKLSVCMIIKNEESTLKDSIISIKQVADELIIVDTGSTDNSKEIARSFTDNVFDFEWVDDFAKAVNFAVSKATNEYICKWDGDFVLEPGSLSSFKNLKQSNFNDSDLVFFKWNNNPNPGGGFDTQSFYYFIHRKDKFIWHSPIHVYPKAVVSNIKSLYACEIEVNHYKDPVKKAWRYKQTLNIMEKTIDNTDPQNRLRLLPFYVEALIHDQNHYKAIPILQQILTSKDYADSKLVNLEKLVECYFHLEMIEEATEFIDKYRSEFAQKARFILLEADILAMTEPAKAVDKYRDFLSLEYKNPDKFESFDRKRYIDHPIKMLEELEKLLN